MCACARPSGANLKAEQGKKREDVIGITAPVGMVASDRNIALVNALARRCLVDYQQREPLAAIFGGGFASSSDGQFFRTGGFGRDAGRVNPITATIPGANSTRTSQIAMRRSTRR